MKPQLCIPVAISAIVLSASAGCGSSEPSPGSVSELASDLRQTVVADYSTLEQEEADLGDIESDATVVGSGRLIDVRRGYTVDYGAYPDGTRDEEPFMLLVVEPDELSAGAERLGDSGLVFIDHHAPPENDPESPLPSIDEMRASLGDRDNQVVFFLRPSPIIQHPSISVRDEFAGRAGDDPLFAPVHPSTFLGVQDQLAFPLFTDELIEDSHENLAAVAAVGADVEGFARLRDGGALNTSSN